MNTLIMRDSSAELFQAMVEARSEQDEVTLGAGGAVKVRSTAYPPVPPIVHPPPFEHNGHNGHNSHNGHAVTPHPAGPVEAAARNGQPAPVTYTLSQVAELTGLYPQYLLNLVERYKLVQPAKIADPGARAVYHFTTEHVDKIRQFVALTDKGVKAAKAVRMVGEAERLRADARQAVIAIGSWLDNPGRPGEWPRLVAALTRGSSFTEQERALVLGLEGEGRTMQESMAALGIRTEKEARDALHSAYHKVGEQIFQALRTGVDG